MTRLTEDDFVPQATPWDSDDEASRESESDLIVTAPEIVANSVLAATDWTAETILNQLRRGNIDLNPRFQRRDAWRTAARKSRFIESIVLGLPIPQIVLAERRDRRGAYVVIDGKQRLLSLRQFAAESGDGFTPLVLEGLEVRSDLNGLTLDALKSRPELADDLAAFENQTIRTVVVRQWPDEDFLYLVFLRLNTGSVPLSPQELRQALHPGPFMDFADEFAQQSPEIRRALGLQEPDFRMRDVELLIRYIAFDQFLPSYGGNLKQFLDSACLSLNAVWPESEGRIRELAAGCEASIAATYETFASDAFRRWTGERWERTFNRAVFDVQTFYFKDADIAARAAIAGSDVVDAFRELSTADAAFAQSLQTTTKSVAATYKRLSAWGTALAMVLDTPLPVPTLRENRIHVG